MSLSVLGEIAGVSMASLGGYVDVLSSLGVYFYFSTLESFNLRLYLTRLPFLCEALSEHCI